MFYPFLVADPRSGLQYRLSDTGLTELSLAPKVPEWAPGRAIADAPDPVWQESLANAPVETISAVTAALEGLVLATPDLRVPAAGMVADSRAGRHLDALIEGAGGGGERKRQLEAGLFHRGQGGTTGEE